MLYFIRLNVDKEIEEYTESIFESIKHIDEKGNEYWYAREMTNTQKEFERIRNGKLKRNIKNITQKSAVFTALFNIFENLFNFLLKTLDKQTSF